MKEFIEELINRLKELQQYYIYSIDDLVRLKEVESIAKQLEKEYKQEPYAIYETIRSDRLDCEVPSDCFEQIKEVRVIDEWTAKTKVYKEYSADTSQKSEGAWIPCSERLPEGNDDVMVIYTDNDGEVDICCLDWFLAYSDTMLAWMPLPEPYKPQKEAEWKDHVMKHFTKV